MNEFANSLLCTFLASDSFVFNSITYDYLAYLLLTTQWFEVLFSELVCANLSHDIAPCK